MIHDLDVVLAFAKSPVKEIRASACRSCRRKSTSPTSPGVRVGLRGNFTAAGQHERIRKLRFFQPHQYISLDYSRQDVLVLTVDDLNPSRPRLTVQSGSTAASASPASRRSSEG